MTDQAPTTAAQLQTLAADLRTLVDEVQQVVVGQDEVIRGVITCLLAGGHGLLEGVPGLGKTLLIRTVAEAVSMSFNRIQFTPDLMPADILGTSILVEGEDGTVGRTLEYQPGPIFSNIVLADEINRATPKTQSALLEAMAEGQVTGGGKTRKLPQPFFVLATQNPLEQEGTYPLPEAQLDRFLFKINVEFPDEDELIAILDRTTGSKSSSAKPVLDGARLVEMQRLVRAMPVTASLTRYVVRVLRATHPGDKNATEGVKQYVRFGGSPRGAQSVLLAARVRAAIEGRESPSVDDVKAVVPQALRHRVLLNFEGEAEGVAVDAVLEQVLSKVKPD
ncbi:methanol dehydrogenase regulator [Plesiocystis pacifica SIR-1]|uniref:Methanol dehydrogenase regulator n=1 Tax=Plesiocystis pacifica SIR-1 TaxID=391625 RepID=A6GBX7_9BACT|nr:MoxR family ATPase [Plesiocystis pacifica]EDM76650.1 methanol dehydrogenase regulator [Plesiocystis pacifica SIR-1]